MFASACKATTRLLALLLASALVLLSMRFAWIAFTTPVELEIREGSIWIQALAQVAGVDVYDGTRVAFVNMNHGPLMTILVAWCARCFPSMPGYMVMRLFVLAYPLFLFAAAYRITREDLTTSLLATGGLYLFFANLALMLFVGRTDILVLCAVAICAAVAHELLVERHRQWTNLGYVVKQALFGATSAVVFLICWRYLPVFLALQLVVLSKQLTEASTAGISAPSLLLRYAAKVRVAFEHTFVSSSLFLVGFAAVWLPVFVFVLHADPQLYYRRFFGFFTGESGWGSFAGSQFELIPEALVRSGAGTLWLSLGLVLLGLFRIRKERAQFIAWLLMLCATWLVVDYGYYKNQAAGGLHYFFEFFALAWFFILHSLCRRRRATPVARLMLIGILAAVFPWQSLKANYQRMSSTRTRAVQFKRQVAEKTHGKYVYGEETHLFKTRYTDEVIDTGDTAEAIARSGFFGEQFTRTFESYQAELSARPPKYVLTGVLNDVTFEGVSTSTLYQLLRSRYTLVAYVADSSYAFGGSQALFERTDE